MKEEFYQGFYESAYAVWLENSLVSDTGHRLEHTCMLIYTWFCIIQTYQKDDGIPQIAISAKIMQAILANLTRLDDSRIS